MDISQLIKKPVITEKSMKDTALGKYIFKVDFKANIPQIAKAIEKMYKVKVIKVNIISVPGKIKNSQGRSRGKTVKPWKKAIVTLKKGQKIEGFEIKE